MEIIESGFGERQINLIIDTSVEVIERERAQSHFMKRQLMYLDHLAAC